MELRRITTLVAAAATAAAVGVAATGPAYAAPTQNASGAVAAASHNQKATITSTINQTIAGVGTIAGTFTPTKFFAQNGQLNVTGVVRGTLTSTTGALTPIEQTVSAPVLSGTDPQCQVLDLVLGPLNLNLLGLVVTLNQVHLNITAVSGPGNLLGNLLCAVANLLNGSGLGAALNSIVARLNALLGML